jgi:SAM-dependent methyltransferase
VPELFDTRLRALRRDRAARTGTELFLHERAFEDCLERIGLSGRGFEHALIIGSPDPGWPTRTGALANHVEVRDPGVLFAERSRGEIIREDRWQPQQAAYDLVVAVGTLDTVNDLPLALQLIRYAMRADGLFIGALSGGDTLPKLRSAMRAADSISGGAAPHVHPRIEAASLAPLLEQAGFVAPVVDVDRVPVSYKSFDRLVRDLRAMGATNLLHSRPRYIGKRARAAAFETFNKAGDGSRTVETFEILHFAAWTPKQE